MRLAAIIAAVLCSGCVAVRVVNVDASDTFLIAPEVRDINASVEVAP